MNDLISRQAALVAVKDALMTWSYMPEWRDEKILEAIAELPPAQPEPKRGKWIYKTDLITVPTGYWECSECKEGRLLYEANFCPNCGAEMKVTK